MFESGGKSFAFAAQELTINASNEKCWKQWQHFCVVFEYQ